MSILFAVRIFGDLCLYFAAAGAVGGVCGMTMNLWIPAAVCAVAMGVACLLQDRPVRILSLLLLIPCMFLPKNTADWVILAPTLAYAVVLAFGKRFVLTQGDYLEFFPRGLIALGIVMLISLLGLDLGNVFRFGAAYVLCGVYLMRQLRLPAGSDWKDKALNLVILAAVLVAGALSSLLVRGLGALVTWLWGRLRWLFALLERLLEDVVIPETPQPPVDHTNDVPLPDLNVPPFSTDYVPVSGDARQVVKTVVIAVLIAAAVIGVILLVRKMLASFGGEKVSSKSPVWTERASEIRDARRRTELSNRDRIRRVYQKFLRILTGKGAVVRQDHTTADVHLLAIGCSDPEASEQLRDIYRTARYDEDAEITGEQLRKAKELLRKLD